MGKAGANSTDGVWLSAILSLGILDFDKLFLPQKNILNSPINELFRLVTKFYVWKLVLTLQKFLANAPLYVEL